MEIAILITFCLFGLVGTLLPALPGSGLIFIGALAYAALTNFQIINTTQIIILFGLMLIGAIGQFFITSFGARVMGAGKYGIIGAFVGFFLGMVLIPAPGGCLLGAFAGAFICELAFAVKSQRESLKAGIGAVIGALFSLFFEFFIGVVMVAYTIYLIWHSLPPNTIPV
ncbi:MAG: DUF456 domain-containing protein [Deltaproteobacteria bacterium]|nr:DUF456 domain-containing protein [Deltaproteobacteria bacterium]